MWQKKQSLSGFIWFQDGAYFSLASTVRVLPFPPPLTLRLILNFYSFLSKEFTLVEAHFLVSTIRQVILPYPGTLGIGWQKVCTERTCNHEHDDDCDVRIQ